MGAAAIALLVLASLLGAALAVARGGGTGSAAGAMEWNHLDRGFVPLPSAPEGPLEERWSASTDAAILVAAAANESMVFVSTRSEEDNILKLSAHDRSNGELSWEKNLNESALRARSIARLAVADNTVFVSSGINYGYSTGRLIALDANSGELLWSAADVSSLNLVPGSAVMTYHHSEEELSLLDWQTGEAIWRGHAADFFIWDGRVVIRSGDGISLLGIADGELLWDVEIDGGVHGFSGRVAAADGQVAVIGATGRGDVNALDAETGELLWSKNVAWGEISSTGSLIIVSHENGTVALGESGSELWEHDGSIFHRVLVADVGPRLLVENEEDQLVMIDGDTGQILGKAGGGELAEWSSAHLQSVEDLVTFVQDDRISTYSLQDFELLWFEEFSDQERIFPVNGGILLENSRGDLVLLE